MVAPRPHAGVMDITPYKGGEADAPGVGSVIKLSSNESALGPSAKAVEAYRAMAGELHRYPDGEARRLRQAISRRHNLPAQQIVCGAGSDELISLLITAYAGAGEEVLYSAHGFLMYRISAMSAGAIPVAAEETDLRADVDKLLAKVTSRTRIVFVANPNNPTGSYLSAAELRRLRAGLPDDVILAVDAAYAEYVGAADYTAGQELVEAGDNVVMLRTFSKIYGLSALRVGWCYAPTAIADALNRVRGPFNVSAAAQAAAVAAIEDEAAERAARVHNDTWLPWLAGELDALGLTPRPSVGNFLIADFGSAARAEQAFGFLKSRGILVRMIAGYGLPHYLRITVGREEDNKAVIGALKEFVAANPAR
jgi:histidinol-phosphate aminotransferase